MWETVIRVKNEQNKDTDRMIGMIIDVVGPEFSWDVKDDSEIGSGDFYHVLRDANEPLWLKYETYTVLSIVLELLNLKIEFNMMVNCHDRMVGI